MKRTSLERPPSLVEHGFRKKKQQGGKVAAQVVSEEEKACK
jgi:hypothetical protein